ncbi:MAG: S9 family peptidase [Jatrophihabitans sp.]
MRPTDIVRLVVLAPPTISPDGRSAVVAATRIDLDEDAYRSRLWQIPTDGSGAPRPLTHGEHDSAARYSPDGRWIAFLRATGEDRPQLFVLPVDGGDARRITELSGGAGEPVWAPDSRVVAFSARVLDPGRYGQDDKITADKEAPRRITGLQYRADNVGFVLDRRKHVFVVDVTAAGPSPQQLTFGDQDDVDPAWSPDGSRLAFVSARHDDHELDRATDVFVMRPDGSDLRPLTDSSFWLGGPVFTADGASILAVADDVTGAPLGRLQHNQGVVRIDATADSQRPMRLTDEETVHVVGDRIVLDGAAPLVLVENRGAVDLVTVSLDGSAPQVRSAGQRQLSGVAVAAGITVVTYSDMATAGELGRVDGPDLVPLTDFGAGLRDALRPVVELTAEAPDGYPVHGWLATPPGDGPHPVLLMIHGGPFAQYGWTLLDEVQVYVAAGYAVVYGNPRGSSGYGQAHGRWILGDVGEKQSPDLYALLDAATTRQELDATRVGVLGGSHGGYMTSWLIGHTNRFRAAVSERAVNAIDSFEGASDIGWDFADSLYGTDDAQRRRQSPLTYVQAVDTPLLIVHSEHDWRCPLEQAQRLFVALRRREADVELLLFPGEGHELSRSGLPSHRVARFDAIVDWFNRHLA